ncbi:MAG TPA: hypothetical protein VKI65_00830, partial [Gemmataceae bacterium]|nr:hypothetical protein [Gemmataceae bacterium]
MSAQGQFQLSTQRAALAAEAVSQARLETRRREFDEWLYDRANRPIREDEREVAQQHALQRSRDNPPASEIYSGIALNTLLAELQKLEGRGVRPPEMPLAEDVVRQINVTTGNGGAHVGLLKNEGKLDWPIALRTYLSREQRGRVADLAQESMQEAKNGKQAAALREMDRAVRQLHLKLREVAAEIPPGQFIEAKRFLNQLDDAVRALQGADAADYVNGKYAARGKSVAGLVQHMTKEGLQFAPAVAGDEAGYLALHRALVAYETQGQAVLVAER